MGAMFIGQQFLQNVLGYSTVDAGLAILPAAAFMVLVAPRSAKLVERRGARFTLLFGYLFVLLGFLTMLLLWKEDIRYWKVALGYSFVGIGVGLAGTPASHSLTGSVPVKRVGHGLGHRRPAARPRRRDHAVDLRRAAHGGLRGERGGADLGLRQGRLEQHAGRADEVVLERGRHGVALPGVGPGPDHRRSEDGVPPGRPVGVHRRHRRRRPRSDPRLLHVPEAGGRAQPARAVPGRGRRRPPEPPAAGPRSLPDRVIPFG